MFEKLNNTLKASALIATLCTAGSSMAAITVLHEWNLGDNDGAVSAGDAVTTSVDNVGSNGLTAVNTVSYVNTGAVAGLGVTLGGEIDHLNAGSFTVADGKNWGVELWYKHDAAADSAPDSQETLFSFNDGNAYNAMNAGDSWNYTIGLGGGGVLYTAAAGDSHLTDTWSHIVYLFDNGTLTIWQDGDKVLDSSGGWFTGTAINNFIIGASQAGTNGFDGDIGAVRVFEFAAGQFDINDTLVPEPGSLALLGIGGLLLARRRRGA